MGCLCEFKFLKLSLTLVSDLRCHHRLPLLHQLPLHHHQLPLLHQLHLPLPHTPLHRRRRRRHHLRRHLLRRRRLLRRRYLRHHLRCRRSLFLLRRNLHPVLHHQPPRRRLLEITVYDTINTVLITVDFIIMLIMVVIDLFKIMSVYLNLSNKSWKLNAQTFRGRFVGEDRVIIFYIHLRDRWSELRL